MLVLVGSGEYLPPMAAVDSVLVGWLAAGRNEPVRVACLATAAGTEGKDVVDRWQKMGVDHFDGLGAVATAVPVLDQASANDPELADQIETADLVYLSGGKPAYLYQTLAGSAAWRAISTVHQRGGIVAGCSAGAMIFGQRILGFPRIGLRDGFGLFPGAVIVPHFDEIPHFMARLTRLLAGSELTLVGIDGTTALVANGRHWQVLGQGGVTVLNRQGSLRYTTGPMPCVN